jgi:hypothetical protein
VTNGNHEIIRRQNECSIDSLRRAHSALHVERAHVLPVLLEQRDEEVGGERQVRHEFLLRHAHVADTQAEAQRLLHLKLNRPTHLLNFGEHVLRVLDERRELAGFVETRAENTRDLLDNRIRRQERVVRVGELFDEFLVLVELLECLDVHERDVVCLGLIAMDLVAKNAYLQLGARNVLETNGSRKTFVLLKIVILQTDLELYALGKATFCLFIFCNLQNCGDSFNKRVFG